MVVEDSELILRVLKQRRSEVEVYLDGGWPNKGFVRIHLSEINAAIARRAPQFAYNVSGQRIRLDPGTIVWKFDPL